MLSISKIHQKYKEGDNMSKYIAAIPLSAITRLALVEAGGRSMAQVKEAAGCDYIINSWFYSMTTGRPVGNLCIDGEVKARANWAIRAMGNSTSFPAVIMRSPNSSIITTM